MSVEALIINNKSLFEDNQLTKVERDLVIASV